MTNSGIRPDPNLGAVERVDWGRVVKYQIMFVIAAAICLGILVALHLARKRLTTDLHQIRWDAIVQKPT